MLKDVRFMGVKDAIKLAPSSDTVIISILNQFEECNRPEHLHQFRDHLILHFVDTFEKPGEPEGAGPDVRRRTQGDLQVRRGEGARTHRRAAHC
ncbi:hypothetical protein ACFJGX_05400 [Hydrogenophaga sp. UC242_50]|uniref:hypothetical protein n=1 Tax=Hydrogenophaga sp. UC242_50 TaxID=3350169 RepID=UPI0036D2DB45